MINGHCWLGQNKIWGNTPNLNLRDNFFIHFVSQKLILTLNFKNMKHLNFFKNESYGKETPIEVIQIHPSVKSIIKSKKLANIEYTMKIEGQFNPVLGNWIDGVFYITDGVARYEVAKSLGWKTLKCLDMNISDDDIIKKRMISNQKAQVSYTEMANSAEHLLGIIGKSQGKKRESMGFNDFDNDENYGTVGMDRFQAVIHLLNLPIGSSSLRKLMAVYWYDQKDNNLGLMDGIDSQLFSVDQAYRLIKKDEKIQEKNLLKEWRIKAIENTDVWSKVFHESSDDLSNLKEYRPNFAMFSPPYWKMKEYRNQGEMKYGQEPTVEDYINNCRKFIMSLIDIMDENGVIAIVIGESYQGGFKSVLARYELMLEERLDIIGKCPWIKENPTPSKVDGFFRPADETVFICKLKGGNHVFNPKMTPTKDGKKGIKNSHKSKNGGIRVFLQDEERVITNVIETPVCNPNEYKKYDPNFTHDAPCPMEVYQTIVESYTLPGMTAIDIHCGAGQGLEVFSQNGLNSLGVDIDIESVEFCRKRMSMVLGDDTSNDELQMAA